MSDQLIPVPEDFARSAWIDKAKYEEMYRRSIDDPEGFWGEQGKRIDWFTPYTKVKDVSFDAKDLHIRWFYDGTLNASYNCLDRHLETRGDQVAIIWEGDDPAKDRRSEEHTSELQSLMRISYAVFCLKKKNIT